MLKYFSPATRIAIGLTGAVLAVMCGAKFLSILPDRMRLQSEARTKVAESIAMSCSALIVTDDQQVLKSYLEASLFRNEHLLSCAIRNDLGKVVVEAGDHSLWTGDSKLGSDLSVPIFRNQNEKWGEVELRFTPLLAPGWLGVAQQMNMRLMLFIGFGSFLAFSSILRLVLKQLDPSNAVPQRVREALNTLAEGLMIIDSRSNVLLVNNSLANVFAEEAEAIVGRRTTRFPFEPLSENQVLLPWEVALAENRSLSEQQVKLRTKDSERHYSVNCSILHGHDGKSCGVMVTFDDITVLEKNRSELRQARDAAHAANKAKSDFLANMSHEIRTPMNAILGFTDVLRRGLEQDREQQQEYLNTIHASGNHLIELINDILDLSKVEAGKLELEQRELSLPELVQHTVNVLSARANEKKIDLQYRVEGRVPDTIRSDPTRLRQILMNLTGNAIKFTEEGGVRIVVSCQADSIRFDVVDSGVGIAKEKLAKIFDPFSQADSSVTRRFGGTGLGLSICKRIAEALGGSISVRSRMGEGSVFSVQLPVEFAADAELLDEAEFQQVSSRQLEEVASDTLHLQSGRTVLVVDDGVTNRQLVSVVLKRQKLHVLEAENGQEALDLLASQDIDLVLMDVQMPVLDGKSAARLLRQRGDQTPLIALTGNAMQGERQKCLDAGFDGYLAKPIDIDQLLELLSGYLGTEERKEELATSPEVSNPPAEPSTASDGILPWTSSLPMDDEEFRKIVQLFLDNLAGRLEEMRVACQAQDFEVLADLAHWLKGAGGTVGLARFTEPSSQLEVYAKAQAPQDCKDCLQTISDLAAAIVIPSPGHPSEERIAGK